MHLSRARRGFALVTALGIIGLFLLVCIVILIMTEQNSQNVGMWSLDAAGDVTYSLAAAVVSQVPLPGALWLFGSGLLALVGIGRRRNVSADVSAA